MFEFGFIKVSCAVPKISVADPAGNLASHLSLIEKAEELSSFLVLFPELSITGYTCGDLFLTSSLIYKSLDSLREIVNFSRKKKTLIVVGLPLIFSGKLYNSACVIYAGKILGIVPKSYIPDYKEFYELRWFASGKGIKNATLEIFGEKVPFGTDMVFYMEEKPEITIGIEICEDLWGINPPSSFYAENGATILLNLSASNALVTKNDYRKLLVKMQSAKTISAYAYCNTGVFESTTDMVFDGSCLIYENGVELASSECFKRDEQIIFADVDVEFLYFERARLNTFQTSGGDLLRRIPFEGRKDFKVFLRKVEPYPFVPKEREKLEERTNEILNIQVTGLCKRLESIPDSKAVIGLSGGLDSTLAFLVTVESFKKLGKPLRNILAITMPGFGTSKTTFENVKKLVKFFDVSFEVLPVKKISKEVLHLIGHSLDTYDTVFENVQARARTYILMMKANQIGGIVIGTSDLSEIALGFCTYNGDHISMYNVNSSVPKTLVKFLIKQEADKLGGKAKKILYRILSQPISPELLPLREGEIVQKTEEKIGPYVLHDFFLYNFVRMGYSMEKVRFLAETVYKEKYSKEEIEKWLKLFTERFFKNQWKRDCVPGGPKVGSVDLSPRSSWRMPSEVDFKAFLY